jgi:site-specific DNA-methyltransferase (adenine-specific)|tara:strand:+ start:33 stop:653 length:621 start_codon:yes stop_codon:yes gene_type:complete
MKVTDKITITNEDNMELMSRYEDNYFDLAIVDPPYGIGISSNPVRQKHNKKKWDNNIPQKEYFNELFRVSKNQIIWGGNYFDLPPTQGFFIWDKKQPHDFSLAMCEYAWSSLQKPAKMWSLSVLKEKGKIHPTQKPVELYEWLLLNNAKEGDKILDTHLGSGSIAIACHNRKFELVACELDKDYYDAAIKRIKNHVSQITIFDCGA